MSWQVLSRIIIVVYVWSAFDWCFRVFGIYNLTSTIVIVLAIYPAAPAPVPAQNTPAQASPTQFEFAIPPLAPVFQATSTPAPAPPILRYFLCQLNIILPQLRVPHQLKLLLPELGLPSHLWLLFFRPHQLQLLPPKLSLTSQLSLPQPLPSNQNKISIVI